MNHDDRRVEEELMEQMSLPDPPEPDQPLPPIVHRTPGLFPLSMPVGVAHTKLQQLLQEGDSLTCPCCEQNAKIYERPLNVTAARALIALYRVHETNWGSMPDLARDHLADVANQGGYLVLAAHWGLMEEARTVLREDGGRAGYWRVTHRGELFVNELIRVPKKARIYAGRCLGLVGDPITVRDALGTRFDYAELMGHNKS